MPERGRAGGSAGRRGLPDGWLTELSSASVKVTATCRRQRLWSKLSLLVTATFPRPFFRKISWSAQLPQEGVMRLRRPEPAAWSAMTSAAHGCL
jgi:hypothetical protein